MKNTQIWESLGILFQKHGISATDFLEFLLFCDEFTDALLEEFSEEDIEQLQEDLLALNFYYKTLENWRGTV